MFDGCLPVFIGINTISIEQLIPIFNISRLAQNYKLISCYLRAAIGMLYLLLNFIEYSRVLSFEWFNYISDFFDVFLNRTVHLLNY
jgi:hypothetical protein